MMFQNLVGIEKVSELDALLCREVTVGGKVMTFRTKDHNKVVKEMRPSFNEGRDACAVDACKELFGLKKLNATLVNSDHTVVRADLSNKSWVSNMKLVEKACVYLVMDYFPNVGTLVEHKDKRTLPKVMREYLKILLFRGIFRVTDGNYTNVLINENDELCSIDENGIGKREKILDKNFDAGAYSKELIDTVFSELYENFEERCIAIRQHLERYKFDVEPVISNYTNLRRDFDTEYAAFGSKIKINVFSATTKLGQDASDMKSAMQKYLRRGEFEKGVRCLIELDSVKGTARSKGIRSNMINRLMVMVGEDIGPGDPVLWLQCDALAKEWDSTRMSEDNSDRVYLITLYKYMCAAKKVRLASHIRKFFTVGYNTPEIREAYSKHYDGLESFNLEDGEGYFVRGDDGATKELISGFVGRLAASNDFAYYWMFKLLEKSPKTIGTRNRRRKGVWLVFWILEKFLDGKPTNGKLVDLIAACKRWVDKYNNSRNEYWLWVLGCVWFVMRHEHPMWEAEYTHPILMDPAHVLSFYWNRDPIELDPYCLDGHTKVGRAKGHSRNFFVEVSSHVSDENTEVLVELYKEVYNRL